MSAKDKKYNVKYQHKEDRWLTGPVKRKENGKHVPNGDIYTYEQAVKMCNDTAANDLYIHFMVEIA